jgi:hypothetical protein
LGYALLPPGTLRAGTHPRFATLALAQAAAEWPRERLLEHLRDDYERWAYILAGTSAPDVVLEYLHQRAIDEDHERSGRAAAA